MTDQNDDHAEAEDRSSGKMTWSLLGIAVVLLIAAITLPKYIGIEKWVTDNGAMMGLLKGIELLLLVASFGCVAAAGGIKITSSEKSHMEWIGSVLVFVSALLIGIFMSFKLVTIDEFASYRHLVAQRGARAVVEEPTNVVDWDAGTVTFEVDEAYQWICVNVDYFDNDPQERKSKVFYHVPESGSWTFPSHENAKRIGVFYGTGNGPSGENVVWNNDEIKKRGAEAEEARKKAVEDALKAAATPAPAGT